jgi:hypothetical protein
MGKRKQHLKKIIKWAQKNPGGLGDADAMPKSPGLLNRREAADKGSGWTCAPSKP